VDGIKALKAIRSHEESLGIKTEDRIKILIISAVDEAKNVVESYNTGKEAYLIKPIIKEHFLDALTKLHILPINP
jgi:two-component system chemotaxis response regulator CheY